MQVIQKYEHGLQITSLKYPFKQVLYSVGFLLHVSVPSGQVLYFIKAASFTPLNAYSVSAAYLTSCTHLLSITAPNGK